MVWERWWNTMAGILSRARDRLVARFPEGPALRSPNAYEREIKRLQGELETVRAKRERERADFQARHSIVRQDPQNGGIRSGDVDRRLANLQRIRDNRLSTEEQEYERQIHELERQVQERFGPPQS